MSKMLWYRAWTCCETS